MKMEEVRQELFDGVVVHVTRRLKTGGVDEAQAGVIAVAVADELADVWAGQVISFPKNYLPMVRAREDAVLGKFDGTNAGELAREYRMTERGMRKLIARAIERRRTRTKER